MSKEFCSKDQMIDSEVSNLTDHNSILFERNENVKINEDRLDVYINKFGGGEPYSPPNVSSFQNSLSQYQHRSSRPGEFYSFPTFYKWKIWLIDFTFSLVDFL